MFDDENAEEVGVSAGAEDVPGESSDEKCDDGHGMKKAEDVAPLFGEERPEEDGAAREDERGWAFGEDGKAQEEAEDERDKGS